MATIENLVSKIIKDAEVKAAEMIANAEAEAKNISDKSLMDANVKKSEIIERANQEAKRAKELIVSSKKLEIRDLKLKAKQELIDDLIKKAVLAASNMTDDEFQKFVLGYLSKIELSGNEEIIISEKYKENFDINAVNAKLNLLGKTASLKLSDSKKVDSGFAVLKGGIENSNTFASLADYYRDDLERIILENLFSDKAI